MPGRLRAARPRAQLMQGRADWYRISNAIGGGTATIHIYDEISDWGITASDFVRDLSQVSASQLDVHVNSPGGAIFDGLAIMNALRQHPATVNVYVDGLAASIASVIAMAGDRVVMAPNSQMMIHDGSGLCIGNAAEMRAMADLLDRQSNNIADVYASRAGGTAEEWRDRMTAETWYTAQEAVDAGLADEVASTRSLTDGNPPENSWAPATAQHPARAEAPALQPVASAVDCSPQPAAEPPAAAVEPVVEPADEPPAAAEALEPAPEPVTEPDPWAAAIAHLYSAPSPDDAFTRLTEALL